MRVLILLAVTRTLTPLLSERQNMVYQPGGRFIPLLTGQPQARPGACFVCSGINGPFVDTQRTDDFLGAFFLCYECIKEMAVVLDIVIDINPVEVHNAYMRGIRDASNAAKKAVNEFADSIYTDLVGASAASGDSGSGISEPAPVADDPRISEVAGGQEGSGSSEHSTSLETGGPVSSAGHDGLPGNSGDGSELVDGGLDDIRV